MTALWPRCHQPFRRGRTWLLKKETTARYPCIHLSHPPPTSRRGERNPFLQIGPWPQQSELCLRLTLPIRPQCWMQALLLCPHQIVGKNNGSPGFRSVEMWVMPEHCRPHSRWPSRTVILMGDFALQRTPSHVWRRSGLSQLKGRDAAAYPARHRQFLKQTITCPEMPAAARLRSPP